MTTAVTPQQPTASPLTPDLVLRIAREDAERVYKDLERFRITLYLEPDGWHVEYRLNKPFLSGGGPYYLIDPITGAILSKKYYQ